MEVREDLHEEQLVRKGQEMHLPGKTEFKILEIQFVIHINVPSIN